MPADRGKSSRQARPSERDESRHVLYPAWSNSTSSAPSMTVADEPSKAPLEGSSSVSGNSVFQQEVHPLRRKTHGRRKSVNHIPRPPNAFILFRSSFIKNRHVSTGVETNHSTLSKIIGLTWQNLPEAERQKWHAEAKLAQDEHKRQFPQYAFRPIHTKSKGTGTVPRKIREVGPKDHKRCAKIAELLIRGKKGQELEEAIQEFDKYHIPEIVTRFDTPITANAYSSSPTERLPPSINPRKQNTTPRSVRRTPSTSQITTITPQPHEEPAPEVPIQSLPTQSFDTFSQTPSFDFHEFSFSVDAPSSESSNAADTTFTMVSENSNMPAFNTRASHSDLSFLTTSFHFPTGMGEWARQDSPLSSTTASAPNTPSQLSVPFPDQFSESYDANTYHMSVLGESYGPTTEGIYCDFSQQPSFAPVPEPKYGETGAKGPDHAISGFDRGFHLPDINLPDLQEELDFSSFMQMSSLSVDYSV